VVRNENTERTAPAILGSNPNQSQNEEDFRNQQDESNNVQKQDSKYTGVCWDKNKKKWKAQLYQNKKHYYGGLFENEDHAAMNVNSLCDRLGIEHKNPTIDMEPDKIQQVQHSTSKYAGVSWLEKRKRWQAQLVHKKKKRFGGLFKKEKHAAMKVNLLCDEFGIKRKNPMIDLQPDAIQQVQNSTSIYTGVCWDNNVKKWRVQFMHKQKQYYGGLFDKEEDAAMNVNLLCDECKVKRKNPMIDIRLFEAYQVHNQTSKYVGVSWRRINKCWQAQLQHNTKQYHGGYFDNEEHAAMKINLLCDKFGIQRKNPMVDIKFDEIRRATSQYIGVSWHKDNKKWRALLIHKGKRYSAGLFDNEKHAAMKVNLLCDKFGIQRKNPMVAIKLYDAIRQKTESSNMYQCKAENIVNEKEVKVEEENILYGLKDDCKNNFMEGPCQNQKRKRKEEFNFEEKMVNKSPNHDGNEFSEKI